MGGPTKPQPRLVNCCSAPWLDNPAIAAPQLALAMSVAGKSCPPWVCPESCKPIPAALTASRFTG